MHQLNAGDCDRRVMKPLEAEHHDRGQCVAVIWVAWQDMGDELPALASTQRCRHRDLDAELAGLVWLAFADALHPWERAGCR
jgi:hypothetical protein